MATYTSNYNFKLPSGTDPVLVSDINGNFASIDSNLATWIANNLGGIVDNTLSISGKAADAAVVGSRLTAIVSPRGAAPDDVVCIGSNGNFSNVAFSHYLSPANTWTEGKAADAAAVLNLVNAITTRGTSAANQVYVTNSHGGLTTSNAAASIIKLTNYSMPSSTPSAISANDSVLAAIGKLAKMVNDLQTKVAALEGNSSSGTLG